MAPKRRHDDDESGESSPANVKTLLSSITKHASLETIVLHLMEEGDFDIETFHKILRGGRVRVSFSKATYASIVPFVGLEPSRQMKDIKNFDLHRSRIPTALFKSIVQDINLMMTQYGPPDVHETEETRSRFLSPIFNRLVPVFEYAFRNLSESILEGRFTEKGRVEYYFKAFGSISLLFVEFKLKTGTPKERLDAIGQVIAECDAGDRSNLQQDFHLPVYGILCDGNIFEFFEFDSRTTPPSFCLGRDTTTEARTAFELPDFTRVKTPRDFIHALRPICEIIFDLMLNGYASSLKAYNNRSEKEGIKGGGPRPSLGKWERAISLADQALESFRDAENKRQLKLVGDANKLADSGMGSLRKSLELVPIIDKPASIMTGWDDDVEKI